MVERRNCNFCGNSIEPGTGKMYIRTDGSVFYFDRHKCFVNFVELKRIPRETQWSLLSSGASKWRDRKRKGRPAGARKYVPRDLVAKRRREEEKRLAEESAGEQAEEKAEETGAPVPEPEKGAAAPEEEPKTDR